MGKVSYDQAMLLASENELDLVEVAPNAIPPVARLVDFDKKQYEEAKKRRKQKAQQKNPGLKEIKLGIKIGEHDFDTKINRAKKFLERGHKVRAVIQLRGREMMFQDRVGRLFDRFCEQTNSLYEQRIKRQGKRFSAIIRKK